MSPRSQSSPSLLCWIAGSLCFFLVDHSTFFAHLQLRKRIPHPWLTLFQSSSATFSRLPVTLCPIPSWPTPWSLPLLQNPCSSLYWFCPCQPRLRRRKSPNLWRKSWRGTRTECTVGTSVCKLDFHCLCGDGGFFEVRVGRGLVIASWCIEVCMGLYTVGNRDDWNQYHIYILQNGSFH